MKKAFAQCMEGTIKEVTLQAYRQVKHLELQRTMLVTRFLNGKGVQNEI